MSTRVMRLKMTPKPAVNGWRRAKRPDAGILRQFLAEREMHCTAFSGKLIETGSMDKGQSGPIGRRPGKGGVIYLHEGANRETIDSAVFFSDGGTVFPVFDGEASMESAGTLARAVALRGYRPAACVGRASDVDAIKRALRLQIAYFVDYFSFAIDPEGMRPWAAFRSPVPEPGAASVRRASAKDAEAMYPLAEEYDREEVMTPVHSFDRRACRDHQLRSLERHVVYVAEQSGAIVARAQTNARGWAYDQVGGVFVRKERRREGLGRAVMSALLKEIASEGRGTTLFVKKSNDAALGLYESLGFGRSGEFRIDYFS